MPPAISASLSARPPPGFRQPLHFVAFYEHLRHENAMVDQYLDETCIMTESGDLGASYAGKMMIEQGMTSQIWGELVLGYVYRNRDHLGGQDMRNRQYEHLYSKDVADYNQFIKNWFSGGKALYFPQMLKAVGVKETGWKPPRGYNTGLEAHAIEMHSFDIKPLVDFFALSKRVIVSNISASKDTSLGSQDPTGHQQETIVTGGKGKGKATEGNQGSNGVDLQASTIPKPYLPSLTSTLSLPQPKSTFSLSQTMSFPNIPSGESFNLLTDYDADSQFERIKQAMLASSTSLSAMAARSVKVNPEQLKSVQSRKSLFLGEKNSKETGGKMDLEEDSSLGAGSHEKDVAQGSGSGSLQKGRAASTSETVAFTQDDQDLLSFIKGLGLDIILCKLQIERDSGSTDTTRTARFYDLLQLLYYIHANFERVGGSTKFGISMALHHIVSQVNGTGYLCFDWDKLCSREGSELAKQWESNLLEVIREKKDPSMFLGYLSKFPSWETLSDTINMQSQVENLHDATLQTNLASETVLPEQYAALLAKNEQLERLHAAAISQTEDLASEIQSLKADPAARDKRAVQEPSVEDTEAYRKLAAKYSRLESEYKFFAQEMAGPYPNARDFDEVDDEGATWIRLPRFDLEEISSDNKRLTQSVNDMNDEIYRLSQALMKAEGEVERLKLRMTLPPDHPKIEAKDDRSTAPDATSPPVSPHMDPEAEAEPILRQELGAVDNGGLSANVAQSVPAQASHRDDKEEPYMTTREEEGPIASITLDAGSTSHTKPTPPEVENKVTKDVHAKPATMVSTIGNPQPMGMMNTVPGLAKVELPTSLFPPSAWKVPKRKSSDWLVIEAGRDSLVSASDTKRPRRSSTKPTGPITTAADRMPAASVPLPAAESPILPQSTGLAANLHLLASPSSATPANPAVIKSTPDVSEGNMATEPLPSLPIQPTFAASLDQQLNLGEPMDLNLAVDGGIPSAISNTGFEAVEDDVPELQNGNGRGLKRRAGELLEAAIGKKTRKH